MKTTNLSLTGQYSYTWLLQYHDGAM